MARHEGEGRRVSHAAQGDVRRHRLRGAARLGLVALASGLIGVNWLGWVRYGAEAAERQGAPGAAPEDRPAAPRAPLGLAFALPTDDVERAAALTVVFDSAVVPLAPDQSTADLPALAEVPFRAFELAPGGALQPLDLAGQWSWGGPDRLVFSLAAPLGAGRTVALKPTPALEALAGRPAAEALRPQWSSGPLAVTDVGLRSCDRDALTIEVAFNAPVDAVALASALNTPPPAPRPVAVAGGPAAPPDLLPADRALAPRATVLTSGAEATHVVRYARHAEHEQFHFSLPAGLAPARGAHGLTARAHRVLALPRSFDVIGHRVEHGHAAERATVRVRFDRPLAGGQEAAPVRVTPEIAPLTARCAGRELVLEGAFQARSRYTITVGSSLLAEDGQTLRREREVVIEVPARHPQLRLDHDGGILSPGGGLMLPLTATNVRAVQVTAVEVLPGNLVPHLRGERTEYTSREVLSRVFPLTMRPDRPERHALDLRALFADSPEGARGVYSVSIESTEDRWTDASTVLRITDLVLTLKQDRDGVHAWVQSLSSGGPVAGAAVSALTVTDQLVAGGVTDAAGYVALRVPSSSDASDAVYVVTAERDGDLAYTLPGGQAWSIPKELATGRAAPELADVYVYAERRLYRPGDTAHLTGIARTPDGLRFGGALTVRTLRPDGLELHRAVVTPELAQGLFHVDVPTPLDARTGSYSVEVLAENGGGRMHTVGRARFDVEAFLAARLTLTAEPPAKPESEAMLQAPHQREAALLTAQSPRAVAVSSLAGTSVAGYPVRVAARWTPEVFTSAAHPEHRFSTLAPERDVVRAESAGVLDAVGRASVVPPGSEGLLPGRWSGRLEWTVTEPGGRSVSTVESVTLERAGTHLGLTFEGMTKHGRYNVVAVGPEPVATLGLQWVTVDAAAKPTAAPLLAYELARVVSTPELVDLGGSLAWRYVERLEVRATGTLTRGDGASDGRIEVAFDSADFAPMRLIVRAEGCAPVTLDFHVHDGALESFRPPLEALDSIDLSTASGAVRPGDTVEIDVRAPFDGSLLLTLEDDRLRAQRRLELVGGSARVALTVPRDVRGDVFVSAQVTRPLERRSAWRPHRAHGWLRVRTLHGDHELRAELQAPVRVRPGATAAVEVTVPGLAAEHSACVHLYAVDEGIRVTGGDRLPDPLGHFMAPRRHSTRTTDGWFDLMPDTALPPEVRLIGGDGELGDGSARQRAPEEVRKAPRVVWQSAVPLGRDGRSTFDLNVPDFVGTLTWIAVVVDGDRYGAASAATLVRGDLPLLTTFPRFIAPGDRFVVPVSFENPNESAVTVAVELALSGPARFVGTASGPIAGAPIEASFDAATEASLESVSDAGAADQRYFCSEEHLEPGAVVRRHLVFEADAQLESGRILGEIALVGAFVDGRAVHERAPFDVPVRTGRPLVVAGLVRGFQVGAPIELDLARELGFEPGSALTGRVSVSSSYGVTLEPLARYALDYPYGCAEQTGSRILALLSLPTGTSPALGLQDPEVFAREARERILAGIDRLWSMRSPDGGIAYWPGQREASEWATAYTAEVLSRCKAAGYDVPEPLLSGVAAYLERRLAATTLEAETRVTLLRTLAELGRRLPGWWQRLAEERAALPYSAQVELAFAAALMERPEDAKEVLGALPPRDEPPARARVDRGAFERLNSTVRTLALELELRLMLGESSQDLVWLVAELDEERQADGAARFWNTLDNVAALRALGRFSAAADGAGSDWRGTLSVGDETAEVAAGREARFPIRSGAALAAEVAGTGQLWLRAAVTGRRAADAAESDAGLIVRRRWSKSDGTPLDTADIRLGDLIAVDVTLRAAGNSPVEDVVIVDPLPAGFEVENTRLAGSLRPADDPSDLEPERVELLDDRVLIFARARPRTRTLRYHVRAVQVGTFEHAPVQAEAMYEPTKLSVGGATERVLVR